MNDIVIAYLTYVIISIALTVWVGRTLYTNGRVFLLEVFGNQEDLTDSVNKLLLVAFYLINLGYISLALKTEVTVNSSRDALELMSAKIGFVLCVLGGMHFFNLYIFSRLKANSTKRAPRYAKKPDPCHIKKALTPSGEA